jgi:hypothetical protein
MDPNQPQNQQTTNQQPLEPQPQPAPTPPPQTPAQQPALNVSSNEAPPQPVAAQPMPAPQPAPQPVTQVQQPAPNPSINSTQQPVMPGVAEDTKVLKPKYLLIIFGVSILANIAGLIPILAVLYVIVVITAVSIYVGGLKSKSKSTPLVFNREEKTKTVLFMALSPIISQAIYYYVLKKSSPDFAKSANSVGWKVFGLLIVMSIVLGFIVGMTVSGG